MARLEKNDVYGNVKRSFAFKEAEVKLIDLQQKTSKSPSRSERNEDFSPIYFLLIALAASLILLGGFLLRGN